MITLHNDGTRSALMQEQTASLKADNIEDKIVTLILCILNVIWKPRQKWIASDCKQWSSCRKNVSMSKTQ